MKKKSSMLVLAANLRALKDATPLGVNSGNRALAKFAAIGEGSVARAVDAWLFCLCRCAIYGLTPRHLRRIVQSSPR